MKNADNTICRGFGQETTPQDIARIIGRLVKWGNEFEKFMDRCAPGFKQPHEARIYKHFWMEIDDQIREVAHALGDDRGTVMTYVHSGGVVQHKGGPIINTPTRLVNYLLNVIAHPRRVWKPRKPSGTLIAVGCRDLLCFFNHV